jgi:hypothetical protein
LIAGNPKIEGAGLRKVAADRAVKDFMTPCSNLWCRIFVKKDALAIL